MYDANHIVSFSITGEWINFADSVGYRGKRNAIVETGKSV